MHDIRVGTQDVFKHQLELASYNYKLLQERGVRAFNVMGAIGSGKTLLILRLAERLKEKGVRVGAIAGDVAGNDDHQKFVAAGLVAANLNTGDDCHLDAHRVGHALEGFPLEEVDVLFIENVGNLVCPADFPLGTAGDLVVISVTEGDDMVRKHPKIFAQTDVVAVNKVDLAGFVGVDPMVLVDDYRRLNPQGKVVLTDARSGRGVDELLASLGL
ncbi:MAG TPA: hydrogenase nickel incorporation protein HypB [Candidatus Bipolaricaulis anaerobius]|nr:hydrogenase nickel incorporation protein HypB [Candidatus Bipolaricaulis anaerobius]HNS23182.1 hydrogenase nickel incorporation protein HypB [Candidatus Bipolaricaulis anaerobius]